jgi:hypothetical protein
MELEPQSLCLAFQRNAMRAQQVLQARSAHGTSK